MSRNILVTGATGQVGREIKDLSNNYKDFNFIFTDKESLDITNQEDIKKFINRQSIDTIINCAAYTDVDGAENNRELAFEINYEGVKNLAKIAKENSIKLIHISTDYVFDGKQNIPYKEDDITNPQGVYGKSKLQGEEAIVSINPVYTIIRTSWVYSIYGKNFVKTIANIAKSKDTIKVISDQIGTPTYAKDLAKVILKIVTKDRVNSTIYNYSNEGSCSWYDFAKAILEFANINCIVEPIKTKEYKTITQRPYYSILDKRKIKQELNIKIPYWRDSLKRCIEKLEIKKSYKIGVIGSGFIAKGLANLLAENQEYRLEKILTRTDISKRNDFLLKSFLTNSLDDLIKSCDLIVECSGDAIYATETIDKILKANLPVVTMNSEFHVTTGSYFVDKGLLTEAEGDQPGVEAALHEEAISMGFEPVAYINIKGFLNENPTKEEMEYWGAKSNLSLEMVTSFTDGTKVQIEQTLVANGLKACLAKEGLLKVKSDNMQEGGEIIAKYAKELGCPISDYVLSSKLPAGVFVVAKHKSNQKGALKYYKMGDGPYYILKKSYHLCHLEIIKTIKRVLNGGGVLLNNGKNPKISVAAVAKRDIKSGYKLKKGIGSFDVRGESIYISKHPNHVPIGLLDSVVFIKDVKEGEIITFDDIQLPDSLALNIWRELCQ